MTGPVYVDEHVLGGRLWIAMRARNGQWSWLTSDEAATIGRTLVDLYGPERSHEQASEASAA